MGGKGSAGGPGGSVSKLLYKFEWIALTLTGFA